MASVSPLQPLGLRYSLSNKYFNRLCEVWSQRAKVGLPGWCKCYRNGKLTAMPKMISWSPNPFLSVICNTRYYFVCTWKSNLGTILHLLARVNWANQIMSWENVILPSWCHLHRYAAAWTPPQQALPQLCVTHKRSTGTSRVPARDGDCSELQDSPKNIWMGRLNTKIKMIKPVKSCSSSPEL